MLLFGDARGVDDRLERRTRLAPAVGEDVEPGLELLRRLLAVRVRRADVRDDVARLVVHRDERAVVEVVAAQAVHPALVGEAERLGRGPRVLRVGDDRRRLDPLLGDVLEAHVERGRHRQAAGLDLVGQVSASRAAQLRRELLADLPHELGRLPLVGHLRREHHRRGPRGVEVGGRELAPGQRRAALLHQVEHQVAALHDRRVRRDDELGLVAGLGVRRLGPGVEALDVGVLHEVVRRRATWAAPR